MFGELELPIMDRSSSRERDYLMDLESGTSAPLKEEDSIFSNGQARKVWNNVWSGFVGIDGLVKGEDAVKLCNNNKSNIISSPVNLPITNPIKAGLEKPKKKSCKKPPRPPRPPVSSPLDEADQKLIKELSELAALKQARIERMKKKLKSTKSTSYSSNFYGLVITILFCIVIIWQGLLSHGNVNISFHGSPESSIQKPGRLIAFHNNVPQQC